MRANLTTPVRKTSSWNTTAPSSAKAEQACRSAGFEPDVAFKSNDYNVMQSLVAAGMGVTLLPDLALGSLNPGVRVLPVLPKPPVRRVWAATLLAGSRSGATDAMVATLEEAGAAFAVPAPAAA